MLRLTAASRAGLQEIVCGVVIALLALAGGLALILLGRPKAAGVGWVVLVVGEVVGWWMALYGMARIHRTLNRRENPQAAAPAPAPPQFTSAREATLPPASFSVTDGTTELLGPPPRERERVPVRREHTDTSPIG